MGVSECRWNFFPGIQHRDSCTSNKHSVNMAEAATAAVARQLPKTFKLGTKQVFL